MKKLVKFLSFFVILFTAIFGTDLGNASWINGIRYIADSAETGTAYRTVTKPVATCNGVYFHKIEKAVAYANGLSSESSWEVKALVSAGTITITQSITINSNVTLTFPYSDTESNPLYKVVDTVSDGGGTDFYDSINGDLLKDNSNVYSKVSSKCTLTVNVSSGVTITNNGKIYVGGIQSGGGGGYIAGHIGGSFAKIVLNGTASIVSSGTIVNFGYIMGENCTGTVTLSGTTYIPFVIIEYRGGSIFGTLARGDQGQNLRGSPFNRLFFPNFLKVNTIFNASSVLYAIPDLYTGAVTVPILETTIEAQHNRSRVTIINSNDALISRGSNFVLNNYFDFNNDAALHKLDFYGNFNLNSLTISLNVPALGEVNMSTAEIYFPLSNYYSVKLHKDQNGNNSVVASSTQKLKILPGGSLIIDNGVNVSSPGIAVYKANSASNLTGKACSVPYESNSDATLLVNGILSSTILCGYVTTGNTSASITCSSKTDTLYEVDPNKEGSYTLDLVVTKVEVIKPEKGGDYYSFALELSGPISDASGNIIEGDLPVGTTSAASTGDRWNIQLSVNLEAVSFISQDGSYASDAGAAKTYTLTAKITPSDATDFDSSYGYNRSTTDPANGSFSGDTNSSQVTFTTNANNDTSSNATLKVTVTVRNLNGKTFSADEKEFTRTKKTADSGGLCFLPTTPVTLYDGTVKLAKDLVVGDKLLTFNHLTGKYEPQELIFNAIIPEDEYDIITLIFENGNMIELASGHGLFNFTRNNYEIYYGKEFYNHIGEEFANVSYNGYEYVTERSKLVDVKLSRRRTEKYSPLSEYNINIVSSGVLTIPDDIEGMLDSMSYDDNMMIDVESLQNDIDQYGIYDYEDVSSVVPRYIFDVFQFKYWKAFIGKGTLSYDKVNYWITRYVPDILKLHGIEWDFDNREPLGPNN